jgi:hypothetical protein
MDVVARHHIIEHRQAEALLRLETSTQVMTRSSISRSMEVQASVLCLKQLERNAAIERLERFELACGLDQRSG